MISRFALPIILCAFIVLGICYSIVVPLGEAPDEVSHFAYVQTLVTQHRLPASEGAVSGEAHQAPLYYFIAALATFWIPQEDFQPINNPDFSFLDRQVPNMLLHPRGEAFPYRNAVLAWHLARLLSIAFGAITVWATFQIAYQVFPAERWLPITAAGFVAFLPQFVYLSAVVNNDNLVIALSALSLLVFLRMSQDTPLRRFVQLGVLLGLAALTKISAFALWGAIGLAMLLYQENGAARQRLARIIATFATALGLISPWVIYNWITFGDPINFTRWLHSIPRTSPMSLSDWIVYGVRMDESFWGKFGAAHLEMPQLTYWALNALLIVALIGVILVLRDGRAGKLSSGTRQGLLTFGLYWIFLEAGHLRGVYALIGMEQARQVFAGLPAFAALLIAGIFRLIRHQQIPALILSCGMGLVASANVSYVASLYAPNPLAMNASSSIPIDFGKQIRVLYFRVEPQRVQPGDTVRVQIQWQALNDLTENYWLLFQFVGDNEPVVNRDAVPGAGRTTTDWWRAGQVFSSHHALVVPDDMAPGVYTLRMGLHPFGKWEWLPVRGEEMLTLDSISITDSP